MNLSVEPATVEAIAPWRDLYRHEMRCQIIHDSIHTRPGWSLEYAFRADGVTVGYGSVAVFGPWKGKPTIYECYVLPAHRGNLLEFFEALSLVTKAVGIETQSNDPFLTFLLHTVAKDIASEAILFEDRVQTSHSCPAGVVFRQTRADDSIGLNEGGLDLEAKWLLELEGEVAAAGGILFHYNRPYGDIYMKVAEPFRRRGLGSYLVQELKRACYEGGNLPAARCNVKNVASRKTLQQAGFVPCGHLLVGRLER